MSLRYACVLLLIICTPAAAAPVPVQLTDDSKCYAFPFWSPDGTCLAFFSVEDDRIGIWTMNHDGEEMRALTENGACEFACSDPWSPDGRHLLFVSVHDGKTDLWTMRPDGSERARLTDDGLVAPGQPSSGYGGVWSADGDAIVYTSCLYDNSGFWEVFQASLAGEANGSVVADAVLEVRYDADLWIMDADGGNKRALTTGGDASSPRWQPHGDKIAYLSNRSGTREIWTVERDGTGDHQVTFTGNHVCDYAWSPGGTAIAYAAYLPGPDLECPLSLVDLEENSTIRLTSGHWDQSPVWSPDGTWIAFTSVTRDPPALWVTEHDGSDPVPLASGAALSLMWPQWSPDGARVVFSTIDDLYAVVDKDPSPSPEEEDAAPLLGGRQVEVLKVTAGLSLIIVGIAFFRRR
ncbi:TolB protein [Methanofollis sp. W23]|uniref:TolB family protein n=1 Tax=Methanofollis sp. W23 TaxID=2817849 RepID=UPI001AE7742B|nr:PD40 domain-containing protein [Methanofollis sp. W23]MBP2145139.1 TolB protein [Methanofollis sp. W23]